MCFAFRPLITLTPVVTCCQFATFLLLKISNQADTIAYTRETRTLTTKKVVCLRWLVLVPGTSNRDEGAAVSEFLCSTPRGRIVPNLFVSLNGETVCCRVFHVHLSRLRYPRLSQFCSCCIDNDVIK